MSTIVKKGFKFAATHLISMAVTLFFVFVFGWLIDKWGMYPFSVITILVYVGLFYSDGWNWGRLEGRPYNEIKENPARALAASLIPSIIPLAFALLILFNIGGAITSVIAKIWYFPMAGLYRNPESISVTEILLSGAVIPVVATIGYYVGTKNFSLLERLAFRKNRKKEAAAKKPQA